jgi:hypothetical protein
MTGHHQLLEALGAVFGQAADNRALTDDSAVILNELSHLRPEDIAILSVMRQHSFVFLEGLEERGDKESPADAAATLARQAEMGEEDFGHGMRRLVGHGFAYTYPGVTLGGTRYYVSRLGTTLCEALDLLKEK